MPIASWAICPRRCAITCCASAGAMATTRSSRPSRRSAGSTSTPSAAPPARFDFAKLDNLNGALYPRGRRRRGCVALVAERLEAQLGRPLSEAERERLLQGYARAEAARQDDRSSWPTRPGFYVAPRPIRPTDKAAKLLTPEARAAARRIARPTSTRPSGSRSALEQRAARFCRSRKDQARLGRAAAARRADRLARHRPGSSRSWRCSGRDESLGAHRRRGRRRRLSSRMRDIALQNPNGV